MKPKDAHDDKKPLNGEFGCQGEFDKKGKEHWQIPRGECEWYGQGLWEQRHLHGEEGV